MIDLLAITNLPDVARQFDALPGVRLFVDLERNGKAARQAGRSTFISNHQLGDVGRVKAVLKNARLMVRVNPFDAADAAASQVEVEAVLAQGADMIMLPMFHSAAELQAFALLVNRRVPLVALLETRGALASIEDWIVTPGLAEVFVGLNDLHVALGCRFMFEPLALGHVDRVAQVAKARGLRFGFGGIARLNEGALPGRDVLAEHVRLGSRAVILSRTFFGGESTASRADSFAGAVTQLRHCEAELAQRSAADVLADQARINTTISSLARSSAMSQSAVT